MRVNAALEIPVARKYAGHDEIALPDRFGHGFRQRPRIADAGRAAVSHQIESQLIQVRKQPGFVQIAGDDTGAGRQTRLDVWRYLKPAFHGVFRHQTGADHHRRVARIRATGDGCDGHVAVPQGHIVSLFVPVAARCASARPEKGRIPGVRQGR